MVSIGILREKPLHASLKQWCFRAGDEMEVRIDGFVVDLVRDGLLIEVQTRGFSSLKAKLKALLELGHRVRIVHPIPIDRWIVRVDPDGTVLGRRRSPRHGAAVDVFAELVSIADLLASPDLEIEVVLTSEEEYRYHTPDQSWRRRGWTVLERRLLDVVDSLRLDHAGDLVGLLPAALAETFTTSDLALLLGRPLRLAQQMTYCLRKVEAIEVVGKHGNSISYRTSSSGRSPWTMPYDRSMPELTDHQLVELAPQPTLAVRIRKPMSEVDISAWFDNHLPKLYDEIGASGYEIAGPPFARYHEFGPERADVEIGVPLVAAPKEGQLLGDVALEQIGTSELPGGLVAKVVDHGPYHTLGEAYGPFHDWIHSEGHDEGEGPWESYIRESGAEPEPDDLETEIYWPMATE